MKDKKILILYTGGTIGMMKTEHGYAPRKDFFHNLLRQMPELQSPEMPSWNIIDVEPIIDSSNMTVTEWNRIAEVIAKNYSDYDGFVLLHGTDTMAYTSSALSFMLENCNKAVIVTGSQIPLCEFRNDARDNLITAIMIAAEGYVHEVALYFGGKLFRGNRTMKFSADELIAFRSPNYPTLAYAGINIKYNYESLLKKREGEFTLRKLENVPIGVIKVFPGIQFELFDSILIDRLKGVVLETFGAGNIPGNGDALMPIIKKASENGTVIVVCSQCPNGTVSLGSYETSSPLKKVGAVSGYDLTTEAAVAKLYYLFSCGYDNAKIKEFMEKNLCGEMLRS